MPCRSQALRVGSWSASVVPWHHAACLEQCPARGLFPTLHRRKHGRETPITSCVEMQGAKCMQRG